MIYLLTNHDLSVSASFIKICKRSDADLNDCVKHAVELIRPYLARGNIYINNIRFLCTILQRK